jgi:hypothetical protein
MKSEIMEQNIQESFEKATTKTKEDFDATQSHMTSSLW